MTKLMLSAAAFIATTTATLAAECDPLTGNCTAVPEIDVAAGMAAVAALGAGLVALRERFKG